MSVYSDKIISMTAAILLGVVAVFLVVKEDSANAAASVNCSCHPRKTEKRFVHDPVKNIECPSCHKPSGQNHPKFKKEAFVLTDNGKAGLCNECHERKDTKKYVHAPVVSGDCRDCHDVHQSDNKYQLKEPATALCYKCHNKGDMDRPFPHLPVAEGKCISCHDPHQSDVKFMLKSEPATLCMSCHAKKGFTGKSVHAPVAKGDCTACHSPHGGQIRGLLKLKVSDSMYQPFEKSSYALCFSCHADTIADSQRTDSETNFRNGMFNLHFVHVNKVDKGRSCRVCHDPHASSQPRLISNKKAGFGRWRIPISFTQTSVGGTCVAGCHKPKSYNRIDPVDNQ
jgi:predicted CXXCH cytochrome family protein